MFSPNLSAHLTAEKEIQEHLNQPLITENYSFDETFDQDCLKSDASISATPKPILRIIWWTIWCLLLVVQFSIGLQRETSSNNLHQYTVNWCIGLWIVSSRLFLKTVADCNSVLVNRIPELITCILVVMVSFGWLECAFLAMVVSITALSLYVVVHSLYTLANFSPDSSRIDERKN